jgi:hypothetical protein
VAEALTAALTAVGLGALVAAAGGAVGAAAGAGDWGEEHASISAATPKNRVPLLMRTNVRRLIVVLIDLLASCRISVYACRRLGSA